MTENVHNNPGPSNQLPTNPSPDRSQPTDKRSIGRRQLLKTLLASGGAVTAATLLPGKWTKPVIEVGNLPAHAQASLPIPIPTPTPTPPASPILEIRMEWDTDTDMDLHCFEGCSGIDVGPKFFGQPIGDTIQHLSDDLGGSSSVEVIVPITPGVVCDGQFGIHIGYEGGNLPTTATVTITTQQGVFLFVRTFDATIFPGFYQFVANVTFPGGNVIEVLGTSSDIGIH